MAPSDLVPPTPSAGEHAANAVDDADERALLAEPDPMALFADWFKRAREGEPRDPHAMTLATAGADGQPDARVVLMRDFSAAGFTFYTNGDSAKGVQMAENRRAAACFYWTSIVRQVRLRGPIEPVGEAEADAYFASRARDSQIGAWASDQSRPMDGREALEARLAKLTADYEGSDVPRPPHWRGYRIVPVEMEFWRERPFRLHTRRMFKRTAPGAPWQSTLLYP